MLSSRVAALGLSGLVLVMIATRFPGLAGELHLQDASWALFFIGGFYLGSSWRWAFPALMCTAVLIDLIAIRYYGVSNYCVTVAYWFLVPSYGALWLGGGWLRRHASPDRFGVACLLGSACAAVSLCFLISNGSFYWLGGRVSHPSWDGWMVNFVTWYGPMVRATLAYLALAAILHVLIARLRARSTSAATRS